MKTIRWLFAIYFGGWLCLWFIQRSTERHQVFVPGVSLKRTEAKLDTISKSQAKLFMPIKENYANVLVADFLWFLPKTIKKRCTIDGVAHDGGISIKKGDSTELSLLCLSKGEAKFQCGSTKWIINCSESTGFQLIEN